MFIVAEALQVKSRRSSKRRRGNHGIYYDIAQPSLPQYTTGKAKGRPTSLKDIAMSIFRSVTNFAIYTQRAGLNPPATQPDSVKLYPCRPHLHASRIFTPANLPQSTEKLPLIIQVHGGGFIMNSPARDDPLARFLADTCKCLVVSIDYSKAPQHPFPAAYGDVIELVLAIIVDPDLPIDRNRVMLSGNSVGGNLVLAAAQYPLLRSKILGVMALYPVCDIVPSAKDKMATRPHANVADILESSYDWLVKLYRGSSQIPAEEPRFSPGRFKARDHLPSNMFLAGAEHDLLCAEARSMAEKLASGDEKTEVPGGWQAGDVRWECVKGQTHGFDQFAVQGRDEKTRLAQRKALYQSMADWATGVFAKLVEEKRNPFEEETEREGAEHRVSSERNAYYLRRRSTRRKRSPGDAGSAGADSVDASSSGRNSAERGSVESRSSERNSSQVERLDEESETLVVDEESETLMVDI